jgi:hypothetical protein
MEIYFPYLLTRKQAMSFLGLTRRDLELLANVKEIRIFKTKGGHRRYFREDLIKFINENN